MAFAPYIVALMAGATAPVVATSRTFLGTYYNGNNVTAFTFTNVTFGTANANRRIVLMLATGAGGATAGPTTVTIGGIAATRDYNFAGSTSWITWNAYSAAVPTGTSGTVVINYAAANWNHPTFAAYALYNTAAIPAFSAAVGNDVAGAVAVSVTVNAPAGGVVLVGARDSTAFTAGPTLDQNLSEYYQWAFGSAAPGAGSFTSTSNRDPNATASGSNAFAAAYV